MKATKKFIIGVVAVIALLITIASALAEPIATYNPVEKTVVVQKEGSQNFSTTITGYSGNITYNWYVDDQNKDTTTKQVNNENDTSSLVLKGVDYPVGEHQVLVTIVGENDYNEVHTWTVTVQDPQPASSLSITKVKVNGKTSGKISPSDLNEIEVEVSNDYDQKIEDITVTVRILNVDGDDLEEEEEISRISAGDEKTVTLEFDFTDEILDEDSYTIEVEVEGEAVDNTDHDDLETLDAEVDRKKDDLVIAKAELQDSQVFCSANPYTSLKVKIRNIGENDQDGAKITVKNSELGLDMQKANIDLDDYAGSDSDYEASFALNLEDAEPGTYTLIVDAFDEDSDLMDSEEVELQIVCAAASSEEKDKTADEYYADEELAAELQQKIDDYKTMQESSSQGQFRESNTYVLLLGSLVAMMFFAAALSLTYLLVKKK